MNDLRERFLDLDHRLADLDLPDLLAAAEARAASLGPDRSGVSRPRRVRLLVVVAVVVLGGAALGWAFFASSARDTVSIQCMIDGSSSVIPSATGDPVADCAAQWERETGSLAPRLVAYDNGHGGITVRPADEPPPSGWTPLPDGATQNVAMVRMQQWLDDYVGGLNSGCFDNATAVAMTERALERLGMTLWTVRPAPSDDTGACVESGLLDPMSQTVQLRALDGPTDPAAPYEKLAVKLRSIADGCGSLYATARQVRSAATDLGLSEDAGQYQVTEVRDDEARCTSINENVGGTIFIILRGPSS